MIISLLETIKHYYIIGTEATQMRILNERLSNMSIPIIDNTKCIVLVFQPSAMKAIV